MWWEKTDYRTSMQIMCQNAYIYEKGKLVINKVWTLTFLAAVLNASLWLISGLPALILCISSLEPKHIYKVLIINSICFLKLLINELM
jgi:hypothetical protein